MCHRVILSSIFSQAYYVIIECGVSGPWNVREVVDGPSTTKKGLLFQLMEAAQLPCSKGYGTQIVIQFATSTYQFSLA